MLAKFNYDENIETILMIECSEYSCIGIVLNTEINIDDGSIYNSSIIEYNYDSLEKVDNDDYPNIVIDIHNVDETIAKYVQSNDSRTVITDILVSKEDKIVVFKTITTYSDKEISYYICNYIPEKYNKELLHSSPFILKEIKTISVESFESYMRGKNIELESYKKIIIKKF